MTIIPANPCRFGHPELKLFADITTYYDRLPQMLCPRCGSALSYEEAVRNDERLRMEAEIAGVIERAAIIRLSPGDTLCIGGLGVMSLQRRAEFHERLKGLRERMGLADILPFENEIDMRVIRAGEDANAR